MAAVSPIALLSDFGTRDWFVAEMKAAIACVNGQATVIDITHELPPGDIRAGAFVLRSCFRTFPQSTIFVAAIDPSVGSARKALIAEADGYTFIGPDNGVLSYALHLTVDPRVCVITNTDYMRPQVGTTFHGRDIFAPVAGQKSLGVDLDHFGSRVAEWMDLRWPTPKIVDDCLDGEVVYVDRFGNVITSIDEGWARRIPGKFATVSCCGYTIPIGTHYGQVGAGEAIAVWGSTGLLEISVNGGSAAERLGLGIGDRIKCENRK